MELQNEVNDIKRDKDYDSMKRVIHYGRNKFGGHSKSFDEIKSLSKEMDTYRINSRERLYALESFCVYGSLLIVNVQKLYKIGAIKHAAASLASKDKDILLRALTLLSMLTDDNEDASLELFDAYDIKHILLALNSAQDSFRIEALNILKNITMTRCPLQEFKNYDIVTRSIILLEEGLAMNSEIGQIQVVYSLTLIANMGKASEEFSDAYFKYGITSSYFK
jgi:hypothetical protein